MEKISEKRSLIDDLLLAKQFSDRKQYLRKNHLLKQLVHANPDQFTVSEAPKHGIVGITHTPTNFQIHTLVRNMPPSFLQNVEMEAVKTAALTRLAYILGDL
jgi:hypothetical protein